MGFVVKFNWVLQIQPPASLELLHSYNFQKPGNRVFPLDVPIDLIDLDRTAIAKIRISAFTNESDVTSGTYEVIKVYSDIEKNILTKYWIENQ